MRGVKVNITIKQRMILSTSTNFSLRGCPRPRPPGLVFEGSPFGSFSVDLRSLLVPGYVAPLRPGTSSLVAGFSWTWGNIAEPLNEVARRPRFRRVAPTVDSSLVPGNNPTPIPIPSARRRRQRRSGIENQQVRTKSMLWGHINALIPNRVCSGNARNQKHG